MVKPGCVLLRFFAVPPRNRLGSSPRRQLSPEMTRAILQLDRKGSPSTLSPSSVPLFATWLRPFPLVVGLFALNIFAFLAAVYLTLETPDPELQADFRLRALVAARSPGRVCRFTRTWASGPPGTSLTIFPMESASACTRQSDVILQVHYHPTGKPEVDRTRIGIYFSRVPVKQALHWSTASNSEFVLPAGQSKIEVKASWNIPADVEVLAVSPHMHLLGRDMRMSVTLPERPLPGPDQIPDWDPSWQSTYFFQKRILCPWDPSSRSSLTSTTRTIRAIPTILPSP